MRALRSQAQPEFLEHNADYQRAVEYLSTCRADIVNDFRERHAKLSAHLITSIRPAGESGRAEALKLIGIAKGEFLDAKTVGLMELCIDKDDACITSWDSMHDAILKAYDVMAIFVTEVTWCVGSAAADGDDAEILPPTIGTLDVVVMNKLLAYLRDDCRLESPTLTVHFN